MDLTNRKVLMKKNIAEWYLETPEVYNTGYGGVDPWYETETYIHLSCCFGIPVYGKVVGRGNDCWLVRFKLGRKTCRYFIERKHFTLV